MKNSLSYFVFLLLIGCHTKPPKEKSTIQITPSNTYLISTPKKWTHFYTGKTYTLPDSLEGKDFSFYINHPKIDPIAKAFIEEKFIPSDNDSTSKLVSLINKENSELTPFYRWCLDLIINISDGALGEYPGEPALKYTLTNPSDFFSFMNEDSSGERYKRWVNIIAYSIPINNQSLVDFHENLTTKMIQNCKGCTSEINNSIKKLSNDIIISIKELD
jgi:hypothetical protein